MSALRDVDTGRLDGGSPLIFHAAGVDFEPARLPVFSDHPKHIALGQTVAPQPGLVVGPYHLPIDRVDELPQHLLGCGQDLLDRVAADLSHRPVGKDHCHILEDNQPLQRMVHESMVGLLRPPALGDLQGQFAAADDVSLVVSDGVTTNRPYPSVRGRLFPFLWPARLHRPTHGAVGTRHRAAAPQLMATAADDLVPGQAERVASGRIDPLDLHVSILVDHVLQDRIDHVFAHEWLHGSSSGWCVN